MRGQMLQGMKHLSTFYSFLINSLCCRAVCSDEKWRLIEAVFLATKDLISKCDSSKLSLDDFILKVKVGKYL